MDLIVAAGDPAISAAKDATATDPIPVVMIGPDPVENGFIESLAKPGGNLTGIALLGRALDSKRLTLMIEALPQAKRFAYLVDTIVTPQRVRDFVEEAATKFGVELLVVRISNRSEYDTAFQQMQDSGIHALLLGAGPIFMQDFHELITRATAARLPTSCSALFMAPAGCLFSFGPSIQWIFSRVTDQVTQILIFGAKPGDLPVEQPHKIEFVVNLNTAKALDLAIPTVLLARADEVIE